MKPGGGVPLLLRPIRPEDAPAYAHFIGRIDRKWDTREALRAGISARVPALRQRAKLPNRALLRLIDADQPAAANAG